MGDLNQKLADLHDPDFTSGLPPAVYVDFLQETGCEGPAWEWAVKAAAEIDRLTARVAELEAERDRLREDLRNMTAQVERLREFHDDHRNKPCGDYDAECPIGMGEWFDQEERDQIARAHAALGEEG
ncbi:MAG: bZIP transcription factor [Bacteroidota bacterium]